MNVDAYQLILLKHPIQIVYKKNGVNDYIDFIMIVHFKKGFFKLDIVDVDECKTFDHTGTNAPDTGITMSKFGKFENGICQPHEINKHCYMVWNNRDIIKNTNSCLSWKETKKPQNIRQITKQICILTKILMTDT